MATININVFSPEVQALPNFNNLVTYFQNSATLVDLINRMPEGNIQLTPANETGTFTSVDSNGHPLISIDPSLIPGSPTAENLGTFATTLAHELGHAVDGGNLNSNAATTPEDAVAVALEGEAIAETDEYIVAAQLDVFMHTSNDGSGNEPALQATLDQLIQAYPDLNSADFRNAAIEAGASWTASATPSNAPNLTYAEYYKDNWLLARADPQAPIDWASIQSGQIQAIVNPDGSISVSAVNMALLESPTIKEDVSAIISNVGDALTRETTTTQTYDDGSSLRVRQDFDSSGALTSERTRATEAPAPQNQASDTALDQLAGTDQWASQQIETIVASGDLTQIAQLEVVTDFGAEGLISSRTLTADDGEGDSITSNYGADSTLLSTVEHLEGPSWSGDGTRETVTATAEGSNGFTDALYNELLGQFQVASEKTIVDGIQVADLSKVSVVLDVDSTDTPIDERVSATYSDGSEIVRWDNDGNGTLDELDTHTTTPTGDTVDDSKYYDPDGNVQTEYITTTHPDGSDRIEEYDADGSYDIENDYADGSYDDTYQDADGSYGTSVDNADGTRRSEDHRADGGWSLSERLADGSSHSEAHEGDGAFSIQDQAPDGSRSDTWQLADDSFGSDAYAADGSRHTDAHWADGTFSVQDFAADGSGSAESLNSDGVHEFDVYGSDGSYELDFNSPDGSYSTIVQEADGHYRDEAHAADGSYTVYDSTPDAVTNEQHNDDGSYSIDIAYSDGDTHHEYHYTDGSYDIDEGLAGGGSTSHSHVVDGWDAFTEVAADGSGTTQVDYVDGRASEGTFDGRGNSLTNNFDATGTKVSDSWTSADGRHGDDTYAVDGSSSGTIYEADGYYETYTDDGQQDVLTLKYDSQGNKVADEWSKSDGSHGTDDFAADGIRIADTWTDADGSHGTDAFFANGLKSGDTWYDPDGTHGSDTFRVDGTKSAETSVDADGAETSVQFGADGSIARVESESGGAIREEETNNDGTWNIRATNDSGDLTYTASQTMAGGRDFDGGFSEAHYDAGLSAMAVTESSWGVSEGISGQGSIVIGSTPIRGLRDFMQDGILDVSLNSYGQGVSENFIPSDNSVIKILLSENSNGLQDQTADLGSIDDTAVGSSIFQRQISVGGGDGSIDLYRFLSSTPDSPFTHSSIGTSGEFVDAMTGSGSVHYGHEGISGFSMWNNDSGAAVSVFQHQNSDGSVTLIDQADPNPDQPLTSATKQLEFTDGTLVTGTINLAGDGSLSAQSSSGSWSVNWSSDGSFDESWDGDGLVANATYNASLGVMTGHGQYDDGMSEDFEIASDGGAHASFSDASGNSIVWDRTTSGDTITKDFANGDVEDQSYSFSTGAYAEHYQYADGAYRIASSDGSGYSHYEYHRLDGSYDLLDASPDGSSHGEMHAADGSVLGATDFSKNQDGSYSVSWTGIDGASVEQYASDGTETSASWTSADGSHGAESYDPGQGISGDIYDADGSYRHFTWQSESQYQADDYRADGSKSADYWAHADGSYGSDTFNADGSVAHVAHNADGTWQNVQIAADGTQNTITG